MAGIVWRRAVPGGERPRGSRLEGNRSCDCGCGKEVQLPNAECSAALPKNRHLRGSKGHHVALDSSFVGGAVVGRSRCKWYDFGEIPDSVSGGSGVPYRLIKIDKIKKKETFLYRLG